MEETRGDCISFVLWAEMETGLIHKKSFLWGDFLPILFIAGEMWEKQQVGMSGLVEPEAINGAICLV